jgi:thiamine-monophosphate kinase
MAGKTEKLFELGEREAVERLIQLHDPQGKRRLGDDCAVIPIGKDYLLLTTDMINARTHVPEGARPEDIGWHVAAVNLSDIAAMGGKPLGLLFALGLPKETDWQITEAIHRGISDCASKHGAPVLGGDLKENEVLTISGTAVGIVPKERILWRKGARPGDAVALTGSLGKGLGWLRDKSPQNVSRLLRIEPRLKEGQQLAKSRAVTSCIDTSDGLSASLYHLSRASQVGFELDYSSLPFARGLSDEEKELAMHFGGDYELLFTINSKQINKLRNIKMAVIGKVVASSGAFLSKDNRLSRLPNRGYEHFRGGQQ